MRKLFSLFFSCFLLLNFSCSSINDELLENEDDEIILNDTGSDTNDDNQDTTTEEPEILKILSFGDSYTIGQSVCEECRFPAQLKDSLYHKFDSDTTFTLKIIARTGWTTTNLINAIEDENIADDYNLVTLLIGVNNQYQKKSFSIYETEFPQLVETSIKAANGDKNKVIVVSIPDYAFTPFGGGNTSVSKEIDEYNLFAKNYCLQNEITYVNITDITRQGLVNKALVASDGLHPSELAYTKFVERLLPFAGEKIKK